MPIFQYECPECGHIEEQLVPRFDSPVRCPACGSDRPVKRPSRIAVAAAKPCKGADSCPAAGSHQCCGGCHCHE